MMAPTTVETALKTMPGTPKTSPLMLKSLGVALALANARTDVLAA
jgi:hypothetical protein